MIKITYTSLLFLCLFACAKEENVVPAKTSDTPGAAETIVVKDLRANTDLKGHYTFFSFKNNAIVALADSNTTKWDIGFSSTTIILNGGTSGPGGTMAQVVTGSYSDLSIAPENGYKTDDHTKASAYTIATGSGNGWYNYDGTSHVISPVPGRVIVVKTTDSRYVKMQVLSYYKGMPANPVNTDSSRFYSFRYLYQASGSRNF